jgi:hypothetical protein
MSCPGTTSTGRRCKNGPACHVHGPPTGPECSICLTPTSRTRATKEMRCGHKFHRSCIEEWVERGHDSCPMCRKNIGPEKYKVTLNIENLETKVSNTLALGENSTLEIFNGLGLEVVNGSIELQLFMETEEVLRQYLDDLHVRLADMNSLVFDTEGTSVR